MYAAAVEEVDLVGEILVVELVAVVYGVLRIMKAPCIGLLSVARASGRTRDATVAALRAASHSRRV